MNYSIEFLANYVNESVEMIRDRFLLFSPQVDWSRSNAVSEEDALIVLSSFNYPLPPEKPVVKVRYCGFVELEGRLLNNAQQVIDVVESHPIVAIADTKYPYISYNSEKSLELILSCRESDRSVAHIQQKISALPLIWQCERGRYANTENWFFLVYFKSLWLKQDASS